MISFNVFQSVQFTTTIIRLLIAHGYHVKNLGEAISAIQSVLNTLNQIEAHQDMMMTQGDSDA